MQGVFGLALRIRDFKILNTLGDVIYFQGGSFNTSNGEAEYLVKELVFPFNKLTVLHKTPSKNPLHWFTLVFGILLLFMAVSHSGCSLVNLSRSVMEF